MNIDALPSLVACATQAAARSEDTRAIEDALENMQRLVFGLDVAAEAPSERMLACASATRELVSGGDSESSTPQLNTERMLLEVVATLGELLLCAAAGQRVRTRTAKRLEDVLLPILFIRTSVTPALLRRHALSAAWLRFDAEAKDGVEAKQKLQRLFAAWNRHHGWSFVRSGGASDAHVNMSGALEGASSPTLARAPSESTLPAGTAVASLSLRPTPQPRVALRDIAWNTAAKRTTVGSIPAYLLTKRRRCEAAAAVPMHAPAPLATSPTTRSPSNAVPACTAPMPREARVLALDSPVKRRRRDVTIDVPPSPDRPGRL